MIVQGVDLSTLGDQFHGHVQGRTLILDGDGPAYVAAATVKTLPTAIKRMQTAILTQMFLTKAENAIVHLTANTSAKAGRFNIIAAKPYQGNRTSKAKPPLLESCRQALADRSNWLPEFEVVYHHLLEADDGMMQDAYRLGEHGIIWSDDKDLRMTPHNYWCQDSQTVMTGYGFGKLWTKQPTSTTKLLGVGKRFFWAQMLMGDSADNIAGLAKLDGKLCGPVAAFNYLKDIEGENETANAVLDAYRAINQNPLPEGWLLWMLRWEGDTFWNYLQELEITQVNRAYLADCANRVWFRQPEEHANREEFEDVPL